MRPVVGDLYSPITDALEAATDAYVKACNATALAENAYLFAFSAQYQAHGEIAATARSKFCDTLPDVVQTKAEWNAAAAHEKACKAKCDELKNRLMAAMSWQRMTNVGGM